MGWIDHKELKIVRGLGPIPGDTNSAEPAPVVVNLMSGAITLTPDGWTPNIASVKNGGVWSDSPLSDGRRLLAAASGNVVENINVLITAGGQLETMKAFSGLNQMVLSCRDYWQTDAQIDPVYLQWWAGCGIGPQYALISNIDLSPEYQDGPNPTMRVSLSVEREPYWRGIPPGANPKYWTYYVNASHPQFNLNVASLVSGTDHLVVDTIRNKFEWSPTAYGLQVSPLSTPGFTVSKNYIDIPAASVPGDAPALVQLSVSTTNGVPANLYIGKTSKQYTGKGHDGVTRSTALNLNAGDSNVSSVAAVTTAGAGAGIVSLGSNSTLYYGLRTTTGIDANWITATQWGGNPTAVSIKLDREMYRGTFAIFCRCVNQSATPVLTDMRVRLFVEEFEDNANQSINSVTLPETNPPTTAIAQNAALAYMGVLTLPLESKAVQSPLGYGIQLQNANSNLRITVQQRVDVATANRIFAISDLILVPIDEGMAQVALSQATLSSNGSVLLDNTGYFGRGDTKQVALSYITNADSGGVAQELRGQDIMLSPKVAQRLYFLIDRYLNAAPATPAYLSSPSDTITVLMNIVPRWSGIRDL